MNLRSKKIKKQIFQRFLIGFVGVSLVGCAGYSALYKTDAPVTVASVVVTDVAMNVGERRSAQIMWQELVRRFPKTDGDRLFVELERDEGTIAVREDATAERSSLKLNAHIYIEDAEGKIVWKQDMSRSSAYNVQDTPLSTDIGRDYAERTASISLAHDIAQRVYEFYNGRVVE